MTVSENPWEGYFSLGYKPDEALFTAHVHSADPNKSTWELAEVSHGLDNLLNKCKARGLTHCYSVTETAITRVYRWLTIEKLSMEYLSDLCKRKGIVVPGPEQGPVGLSINRTSL